MARLSSNYQAVLRSLLDSDKAERVSMPAELLFFRLLLASDGCGRYTASPFRVLGRVLASRGEGGEVSTEQVAGWLDELAAVGLIERYEVEGKPYLQIANYYEPPSKGRTDERYPSPDEGQAVPPLGTSGPPIGDEPSPDVSTVENSPGTSRPSRGDLTTTTTETTTDSLALKRPPGDKPPAKSGKSRVSGKAELQAALDALDDAGEPLPSSVHEAAEEYRAVRAERRWPPWNRKRWRSNIESARFDGALDAPALEAALRVAINAPHQSIHPRRTQAPRLSKADQLAANIELGVESAFAAKRRGGA